MRGYALATGFPSPLSGILTGDTGFHSCADGGAHDGHRRPAQALIPLIYRAVAGFGVSERARCVPRHPRLPGRRGGRPPDRRPGLAAGRVRVGELSAVSCHGTRIDYGAGTHLGFGVPGRADLGREGRRQGVAGHNRGVSGVPPYGKIQLRHGDVLRSIGRVLALTSPPGRMYDDSDT